MRKTFLQCMMAIALLSTGSLFLLWMTTEYREFQNESNVARTNYEDSRKEMLKREVEGVAGYIDYQIKQTAAKTRKTVRSRVQEAHSVMSSIYQQNKSSKTPEEIQQMIKDALRNLRFNDGRGYYFIFNLQGIEELFADQPEMEGRNMLSFQGAKGEFVVKDMIKLVRAEKEGFYEYTWTKPGEKHNFFLKISYIKLFAPYEWVIGTGEYVENVTADIQNEVLARITKQKFGKEGYFFGSIEGGLPLFTNGIITKGSASIWNLTDSQGVKITQEYNTITKNNGGGFVKYHWKKPDSPIPYPKISYVMAIPEWHWIIGAGIYLDSIEQEIAGKKQLLFKYFIEQILVLTLALIGLLLLIYFLAERMAGNINNDMNAFSSFFTNAATESVTIEPHLLEYQEFKDIAGLANTMLEARQIAERNYRTLFHEMLDGYVLLEIIRNEDGTATDYLIVTVNPAFEKMTGLKALNILGKDILAISQDSNVFPIDKYSQVALSGKPLDCEMYNEAGQRHFELTIFRPATNQIACIYTDITARIKAEADKEFLQSQLTQAQKMEAIGTLAGGIAHDFNNILGVMLGYAEMVREDCREGSLATKDLDQVLAAGNRASELVKQILAFSRQAEIVRMTFQPAIIVKEAIKLLRASIPTTIAIEQNIDMHCDLIDADPTQLHQIVMNLCTNAFHAMEDKGGTLFVTLKNKTLTEEDLVYQPQLRPGKYVELSVGDTGAGIEPSIRQKIFDPYFTTKQKGKGTGLGLAISHSIVKNCGGSITCESQIGEGTIFHITLPSSKEQNIAETTSVDLISTGTERILLIDDEPMLAEMGQTMLERLGYRVTARTNSLEALTTFKNQPDAFDLVITDQTMPKMTGTDIAQILLQLRPNLPIILCTGYSSSISEEKALALGIKGFALKPLTKNNISTLIRKILDKKNN